MAVTAATNNGGRYNNVHRQTDDGIVISVAVGDDLLPITFRYTDYLGDANETLLAIGFYPHARLMRGDCGWRVKDDSDAIVYSWASKEHVTDGFNESPSGEYTEMWHEEPNCAYDVELEGTRGHRRTFTRKDREYWTPNHTTYSPGMKDIFGPEPMEEFNDCCTEPTHGYEIPTFRQWNPITCPSDRHPNKCGILEFEGGRHD